VAGTSSAPGSYPSALGLAKIFFENVALTFDTASDVLPPSHKKVIHAVGGVAKIKMTITSNKYSGIFGPNGGKYGIGRISAAAKPDYKAKDAEAGGFIPAMALKFFRPGQKSCNWMEMRSLLAQTSWNPFKFKFSNHLSSRENTLATKALGLKFSAASDWITHVGLSDCATYDETGRRANVVKTPFQIVFVPTAQMQTMFPDSFTKELTDMLATIPAGTKLYDMMALESPDSVWEPLGSIEITSQFTASGYGDKSLFFQHQRFDDDLKQNPSWAVLCPNRQACKTCPNDKSCTDKTLH